MAARVCDTCVWFVTGDFVGEDGYGICVLGANPDAYTASQIRMAPADAAEQIRCKVDWCERWESDEEGRDA